jgi:transposase-like protein
MDSPDRRGPTFGVGGKVRRILNGGRSPTRADSTALNRSTPKPVNLKPKSNRMTSSKLSDSEKQEIVRLYQDVPEETTITLAERFGVSSSTVRRILQSAVPKDIYEVLTHQKQRLHRILKQSGRKGKPAPASGVAPKETEVGASEDDTPESGLAAVKRRRRRSSVAESGVGEEGEQLSLLESTPKPDLRRKNFSAQNGEIDGAIADEFFESEEEFGDFDDNEDYGEGEADKADEDDLFDRPVPRDSGSIVKILPLTEASLPKICYLVIDRASELIVKPLKAFGELGHIPSDEVHEKTLPVFDNHRVASRFSARNQRVFKVPDGRLLQKTAPYLQAKGITRLLIDGQVYRF